MASAISKLEKDIVLLLKFIEAQPNLSSLDASMAFEGWPANAGAVVSARTIRDRLAEIKKDAMQRGIVGKNFKMPCSNYCVKKGAAAGKPQRAVVARKRARDGSEDNVKEAKDDASGEITQNIIAAASDHEYPSPPTTVKAKARSTFVAATSGGAKNSTAEGMPCRTTESQDDDANESDSDSLADLDDTPTKPKKRQRRTLPTRRSRAATKYFTEDDADAGGVEESEEEFNPFKLREEERKKDERRARSRQYADDSDDE